MAAWVVVAAVWTMSMTVTVSDVSGPMPMVSQRAEDGPGEDRHTGHR